MPFTFLIVSVNVLSDVDVPFPKFTCILIHIHTHKTPTTVFNSYEQWVKLKDFKDGREMWGDLLPNKLLSTS